jgi:hypothetical protein
MKKFYIVTLLVGFWTATSAQLVTDYVTTGPSYETQVWYSMENGEVGTAPLNNWDIAVEITGFTASIRANNQKGLEVYQTPFAASEWESLNEGSFDSNWPKLYNSVTSWGQGAFNQHYTSDFDLGWGIYNPITHVVSGDSLQVVQLPDGSLKKFRIESLAGGVYTFTHANLDGSASVTATINKDDFQGKNFAYYSIENDEVLDREPLSAEWDITFHKFMDLVQGIPYAVSGVMHNAGVEVSQVSGIPVDEADPWSEGFSADINTIGWDWKTYEFQTNSWSLEENLSFFVRALNGNVYQLVFTDFEGSQTGIYEFGWEEFSALNTEESIAEGITLFPNPVASGNLTITGVPADANVSIFDVTGKLVENIRSNQNGLLVIDTDHLTNGTYIVNIQTEMDVFTTKFIVQ